MSNYGAVLDACVLAPMPLADTLLRLAAQGFFRPFWSDQILAETAKAMGKFGCPEPLVQKRIMAMNTHFPEAVVPHIGGLRQQSIDSLDAVGFFVNVGQEYTTVPVHLFGFRLHRESFE